MSVAGRRLGRKFVKSTASGGGECVEVAVRNGKILVRDSKDPSGALLTFTRGEWVAFMEGVRRQEFELPD